MQRVAVLGASGLLGRNIATITHEAGLQVRALIRWHGAPPDLPPNIERRALDVFDVAALTDALSGVNVLVFAFSPRTDDPALFMDESIRAIRVALQASRNARIDRFVLSSCISNAWVPGEPARTDQFFLPGNVADPFADTKYFVECECLLYAADGMNLSVVLSPLLAENATLQSRLSSSLVSSKILSEVCDVGAAARVHLEEICNPNPGLRRVIVRGSIEDVRTVRTSDWWSRGLRFVTPSSRDDALIRYTIRTA